jgi:DmsE family decaheme c-type cytochrome
MINKNKLIFFYTLLLILSFSINTHSSQDEEDYVGDETCLECHEEIYENFWTNIHGIKGDPRTPAGRSEDFVCESCHGPGATHAEEGEGGDILWLNAKSSESPEKKNAVCLQCHSRGKVAMWHASEHETRALSCADCHNVHRQHPKYLAKPTQTEVCVACHRKITPLLLRQSHHPLRERKMQCSDCHNAHGTIADKLIDAQDINLKCFECHAKTRGPFLWEHPPAVEDCLACHVPHGSSQAFLLNARTPYLCQRCHSNVGHASGLQAKNTGQAGQSVYTALNNRGFYRGCLNCHLQVHGSNHPSGKSLLR